MMLDMKNEKTEKKLEISFEQFEYEYEHTTFGFEKWNEKGREGWEMVQRVWTSSSDINIIWKRKLNHKNIEVSDESQEISDIEAFKNLADWLITNKRSVFLESDISLEDKKKICYTLNISTTILE